MARFIRRAKSKVWFVPTIADPRYPPTTAELNAGIDLTGQIQGIVGFDISNTTIPIPNLSSAFVKTIRGEDVIGSSSLTFYDGDQAGQGNPGGTAHPWVIRETLAKGTKGYIVFYPYGMDKSCQRWRVQTTGVNDEWTTANEAARFQVGFSVLKRPFMDVVEAPSGLLAPTGLHVGGITTDSVELAWDASNTPNFAGYHVYRDGGTAPYESSSVTTPHFFDMNVALGESHTYRVTVFDSLGNESPLSALVSVVVSNDQTPPSQPQNLQVQLI